MGASLPVIVGASPPVIASAAKQSGRAGVGPVEASAGAASKGCRGPLRGLATTGKVLSLRAQRWTAAMHGARRFSRLTGVRGVPGCLPRRVGGRVRRACPRCWNVGRRARRESRDGFVQRFPRGRRLLPLEWRFAVRSRWQGRLCDAARYPVCSGVAKRLKPNGRPNAGSGGRGAVGSSEKMPVSRTSRLWTGP